MYKLLIIEDDRNLGQGIAFAFEKDGYSVFLAAALEKGFDILIKDKPDLILLDLTLPDGDGRDFCRRLRKTSDIPIVMLTAQDLETDEVSGFLSGADDYITKPFSLAVLKARVEALLKRTAARKEPQCLRSGPFCLDPDKCLLYRNGLQIPVSATEFKLLSLLMKNSGQVLTKDQILQKLWDSRGEFVDGNTVAVNISRLRTKIEEDPRNPKVLQTLRGIGYIWSEDALNR